MANWCSVRAEVVCSDRQNGEKGLKPQYIAVREQSKEKHQHYHVALLLDGQKTQSIHNHIQTAERLWDSALGIDPKREWLRIDRRLYHQPNWR